MVINLTVREVVRRVLWTCTWIKINRRCCKINIASINKPIHLISSYSKPQTNNKASRFQCKEDSQSKQTFKIRLQSFSKTIWTTQARTMSSIIQTLVDSIQLIQASLETRSTVTQYRFCLRLFCNKTTMMTKLTTKGIIKLWAMEGKLRIWWMTLWTWFQGQETNSSTKVSKIIIQATLLGIELEDKILQQGGKVVALAR